MKTLHSNDPLDFPEEHQRANRLAERSVALRFYVSKTEVAGMEIDFDGQPPRPSNQQEMDALSKEDQIAVLMMYDALEVLRAAFEIQERTGGSVKGIDVLNDFCDHISKVDEITKKLIIQS